MKASKVLTLIVAAALAAFVAGCDVESVPQEALQEMPEVNDENCKFENIKKIEGKGIQQEFSGKCLRRGSFQTSMPRSY
jgi:entry exclusion lipoprotein TrbK